MAYCGVVVLKTLIVDVPPPGQKDNLPPHWDAMPANTSCLSCPIQPGSTEYNTVQGLFKATCPRNILKVALFPLSSY